MYAVTSAVARAPIAVAKKTNATVAKRAAAVKPVAAVKGANEKVRNDFVRFARTRGSNGTRARGRGSRMRDASAAPAIDARRDAVDVRCARIG